MLGLNKKGRKEQQARDESRCRYCGEKLNLLQRLARSEFCGPEHRGEFQKEQEELALARLQQSANGSAKSLPTLIPTPTPFAAEIEALHTAASLPTPDDQMLAAMMTAKPAAPPAPPLASQRLDEDVLEPLETVVEEEEENAPSMGEFLLDPSGGDSLTLAPRMEYAPVEEIELSVPVSKPKLGNVAVISAMRWEPVGRSEAALEDFVEPIEGDLLTILSVRPVAEGTLGPEPVRLPQMETVDYDWEDELRREEERKNAEPPLAGPVRLSGPQSIRLVSPVSRPAAKPERPVGAPQKPHSFGPHAASGVPRLAGSVRGGMFRTQIGEAGAATPKMERHIEFQAGETPALALPRFPSPSELKERKKTRTAPQKPGNSKDAGKRQDEAPGAEGSAAAQSEISAELALALSRLGEERSEVTANDLDLGFEGGDSTLELAESTGGFENAPMPMVDNSEDAAQFSDLLDLLSSEFAGMAEEGAGSSGTLRILAPVLSGAQQDDSGAATIDVAAVKLPRAGRKSIKLSPAHQPAKPKAVEAAPMLGLSPAAARNLLERHLMPIWVAIPCHPLAVPPGARQMLEGEIRAEAAAPVSRIGTRPVRRECEITAVAGEVRLSLEIGFRDWIASSTKRTGEGDAIEMTAPQPEWGSLRAWRKRAWRPAAPAGIERLTIPLRFDEMPAAALLDPVHCGF